MEASCVWHIVKRHSFARSDESLKKRTTCLEGITGGIYQGKVILDVVRGLKIDLREVLASNIMVDTVFGKILKQGRVLKCVSMRLTQSPHFFLFHP